MDNCCIYSILGANPHSQSQFHSQEVRTNPTCCYRQKVINPNPGDHRIAHKIAARNKISARSCNLKLHQTKGKIKKNWRGTREVSGPFGHKNNNMATTVPQTHYPTAIISLPPWAMWRKRTALYSQRKDVS